MIQDFHDQGTADIFDGKLSKAARKSCPVDMFPKAQSKLEYLDSAVSLEDLRVPPGNRLESLSGDRAGQFSIRINQKYRICFYWTPNGPSHVEIIDYH
ncbi:MAG: type II toxin-antitoxin system RelE/ParE family toxin [Candidatus Delongbacteria bacterium]|nr:type II toxin-antitoxin system RelE/ParE family toxin [Candidatus Delongbacteria bacterium]